MTLGVDFQDGFDNDTVVVRLDGKEAFRKEQVTTKRLLGLAHSFRAELEAGPVSVEVGVLTRDILQTKQLELSSDTYLGVWIDEHDMLHIEVRDEPYGYG